MGECWESDGSVGALDVWRGLRNGSETRQDGAGQAEELLVGVSVGPGVQDDSEGSVEAQLGNASQAHEDATGRAEQGQDDGTPRASLGAVQRLLRDMADRRRLVDPALRRTQVRRMNELHHEICRRLLLGQKNTEIAAALGCTPQTVSNVRNSPIVRQRLAQLSGQRDEFAVNYALEVTKRVERAFEVIDRALFDETGEVPLDVQLREANKLLDRKEKIEGFGQRHVHAHAHAMLTPEDINRLKQRAFQVGVETGQVVDV